MTKWIILSASALCGLLSGGAYAEPAPFHVGSVPITADDVTHVAMSEYPGPFSIVTIQFKESAGRAIQDHTGAKVGQNLIIRANGRIIMDARINEPISGGFLQLSVRDEEAGAVVRSLSKDTAR